MSDAAITTDTIRLMLPEIILATMAVWIYVGGAFAASRATWNGFALVGLALAGYALYIQNTSPEMPAEVLSGPLVIDYFSQAMRWMALGTGLLFVLLSQRAADDRLASEYLGSLLLVLAGLMLVAISGELVLLFLGLELISIPTYILLFLGRRDAATKEATTKYFFLSILSSAILLYGFSFLYGVAGSTRLAEIRAALSGLDVAAGGFASLLPVTLLMILAGLGFRLAAVPFHFYAPDVYQGTTSGNAGLLAVIPKIAGIVALVRLLLVAMPGLEQVGWQVSLALAMVTMTLGNVLALWQRNVRRLMAYSSIAHAGYLLIGIAVSWAVAGGAASSGKFDGLGATLFYLVVYALATTGTFAALAYLSRSEREIDAVDELAGLGKSHPLIAVSIAAFMFSLTGIPPLAGFWGKLSLLFGALDVDAGGGRLRSWFVALAIVGAVNAAISAAYYLRIVAVMYFRDPVNVPRAGGGWGAWLATVTAGVLVVAAGCFPGPLVESANRASRSARSEFRPPAEMRTAAAAASETDPVLVRP